MRRVSQRANRLAELRAAILLVSALCIATASAVSASAMQTKRLQAGLRPLRPAMQSVAHAVDTSTSPPAHIAIADNR